MQTQRNPTMKGSTILCVGILAATSTACNGQRSPDSAVSIPASALAAADTVSELDESILTVFQARNGHYWFGSDTQGVYRYDGAAIVHYTLTCGLWNNRVRQIQEDGAGAIYFTTLGGITRYDGRTFLALPVDEKSREEGAWKLAPGDLWFKAKPGENGVYRYDGRKLYHLEFPKHPMEDAYFARNPDKPWSPYEAYSIYRDKRGAIWIGTCNFGICRFDGTSLRWMYEQHLSEVSGGGWFGIRSIIEDKAGKFRFCNTRYRYAVEADGEEKGLIAYKREGGIEGYEGDNLLYFMSATEDDAGNLWMATYDRGVWRYDGKKMTRYPIIGGDAITVYSIYKDGKGALWLGTHNGGAYKFNGETFEVFKP